MIFTVICMVASFLHRSLITDNNYTPTMAVFLFLFRLSYASVPCSSKRLSLISDAVCFNGSWINFVSVLTNENKACLITLMDIAFYTKRLREVKEAIFFSTFIRMFMIPGRQFQSV